MATILAHIRVKPGQEARFEQLAADLYRSTHRSEQAVRRYGELFAARVADWWRALR
jgi:hypothetical protein